MPNIAIIRSNAYRIINRIKFESLNTFIFRSYLLTVTRFRQIQVRLVSTRWRQANDSLVTKFGLPALHRDFTSRPLMFVEMNRSFNFEHNYSNWIIRELEKQSKPFNGSPLMQLTDSRCNRLDRLIPIRRFIPNSRLIRWWITNTLQTL